MPSSDNDDHASSSVATDAAVAIVVAPNPAPGTIDRRGILSAFFFTEKNIKQNKITVHHDGSGHWTSTESGRFWACRQSREGHV